MKEYMIQKVGMMVGNPISSGEDLLSMLDELLKEESTFIWDEFYGKRDRNVPFFRNLPDENLVGYFNNGLLTSGNALELGCGPGRNAIFLAENGWKVDAVDASDEALCTLPYSMAVFFVLLGKYCGGTFRLKHATMYKC